MGKSGAGTGCYAGPQAGASIGGDPEVSGHGWCLLQNQCHGLLPVLSLEGQGARQHLKLQRTRVSETLVSVSPSLTSSHPGHSAPFPGFLLDWGRSSRIKNWDSLSFTPKAVLGG